MLSFGDILGVACGLAVIHAILPNHWFPFVAVAKARRWPMARTLTVSAVAAGAHVAVTTALGLSLAWAGKGAADHLGKNLELVSAAVVFGFGIGFIVADLARGHRHQHAAKKLLGIAPKLGDLPLIGSLVLYLTLSPCVAMLPAFFAGYSLSWEELLIVALVVSLISILGMTGMVALALKGLGSSFLSKLEERELMLFGLVLIVLGALAL